MSFFITLEASHLPLGRTIARDVTFFLAVEALVAAALGALAGEVALLATLVAFRGGSASTSSTLVGAFTGKVAFLSTFETS